MYLFTKWKQDLSTYITSKKEDYFRDINFKRSKKKTSVEHCGRILERCIYNKVEIRPFNIHYSQKKRIF